MKLICPNCGDPIPAGNINMQHLSAVCPTCDTIFQFQPPTMTTKNKRRKVKQPQKISLQETDGHLNIAFRTNFRLDKSEAFTLSAMFSVIFTFVTMILFSQYLASQRNILIPSIMSLLTLVMYYSLALVTYNKTHINVSDEKIEVSRKPILNFLVSPQTIGLSGVDVIQYDETAISKKEGYDTPRYTVWAETVDGSRKMIVTDVIEEYAVFISQRLNEFLDMDSNQDVDHLLDGESEGDDYQFLDADSTQMDRD